MNRRILTFSLFEAKTAGLTKKQEELLNRYTKGSLGIKGSWTYNPATGLVDVEGNFVCDRKRLKTLRGVKFGKVSGHFDCSRNELTSLEGAPQEVGGGFDCSFNNLTSLEGSPQRVGGTFACNDNKLISLEGAPQEVDGNFFCMRNGLTSLKGSPQEAGGGFWCYGNEFTSLEGAPQKVSGAFNCEENYITSLEGAPQEVEGDFACDSFRLRKGQWNPKGWLNIMKYGNPEAQQLILTLPILSPEFLNKEIQKDPTGMIMKLKSVWKDPEFKKIRDQLVIPDRYKEDVDLVGDLTDLGF